MKIRPTNEYKHIVFGELVDDWENRSIYTPSGFQPILEFSFIKRGPSIVLVLSNNETLVCDPKHIVLTKSGPDQETCPRFAKDITDTDVLLGYGEDVYATVSDGEIVDLYDIKIPSPHWYYTAGIVSHNSLMLCNNANSCVLAGHNVMIVTFELSTIKTALRIASAMSGVDMNKFYSARVAEMESSELQELRLNQGNVRRQLKSRAAHGKRGKRGDLVIYELPPDECSVNEIYGLIDRNKRVKGWVPDVVIVDYLELMLSRHSYSNSEGDYTRQKAVSTELRGLAKNEEVLVFTANQTNRTAVAGDSANPIDVDKSAESFGKNMPADYVISINQTATEYANGEARLWVAKNRNGPKFQTVHVKVNYDKMQIMEVR